MLLLQPFFEILIQVSCSSVTVGINKGDLCLFWLIYEPMFQVLEHFGFFPTLLVFTVLVESGALFGTVFLCQACLQMTFTMRS